MKLSFKIPFFSLFLSDKREDLKPETIFQFDGYEVTIAFEGSSPVETKETAIDAKYARTVSHIQFTVSAPSQPEIMAARLGVLTEKDNWQELAKLLVRIVNHVVRSIRNFGLVAHVKEIRLEEDSAEAVFRKWQVQTLTQQENRFQYLTEPIGGLFQDISIAFSSPDKPVVTFWIKRWSDVIEALQDHLVAGPEREFLVNALEHLRESNYRYALFEAVICLEIVLGQYLQIYFIYEKSMSRNRVKQVLTRDIGLTSRVGLLLPLIMAPDDLKNVNVNQVLTAIRWRNELVHRSGHLPANVLEEVFRGHIVSVLELAERLSWKSEQLKVSPNLSDVAERIAGTNEFVVPSIALVKKHEYRADFVFSVQHKFPRMEVLDGVVSNIKSELGKVDSRFNPTSGLYVRFAQFPNRTIAVWSNGELTTHAEPLRPLRELRPRPQ